MTRRLFTFGSLGLPALRAGAAQAPPARKILIVLVDGFGPEYFEKSDMPNLRRMGREGAYKVGQTVIPSVTNVNNASLVTSSFPRDHGITTNFQYDPRTKQYSEMESSDFLLRPTIFERARKFGLRTALVTSKDKVRTLCARGVDVEVSAEKPGPKWIEKIGKQENMYSADVNYWSCRAARYLLKHDSIDLLYLSTTDYMMHTYAPEQEPSLRHLQTFDKLLAEIIDDHPRIEVYLTADHGMNAKRHALNPALVLAEKGISAEAVPIIRDKHQVHHNNLGGASYVYLERTADARKAMDVLKATQGVEEVYDAATAARLFHLHRQRIGDLFLLASRDHVFGQLERVREDVSLRSHGSRYEAKAPLFAWGGKVNMSEHEYNLDLTRLLALDGARKA